VHRTSEPVQNIGHLLHGSSRAFCNHVLRYGLLTIKGRTGGWRVDALATLPSSADPATSSKSHIASKMNLFWKLRVCGLQNKMDARQSALQKTRKTTWAESAGASAWGAVCGEIVGRPIDHYSVPCTVHADGTGSTTGDKRPSTSSKFLRHDCHVLFLEMFLRPSKRLEYDVFRALCAARVDPVESGRPTGLRKNDRLKPLSTDSYRRVRCLQSSDLPLSAVLSATT
jgi:hypothetical protein